MSKTKKILYLILCILILTILIPILLDYHKVSGLGLHLVDVYKRQKWSLPKGRGRTIPDHTRTKWEWEINLAKNHLPPVETR